MAYEYKYKLTSKQNAPNSCLSTNFVPTLGQGSTDPTSPIHITRQVSFVGSFATCCAVFTCYCNIFSTGESFVCLLKCEVPYFQDLQPKEPCVRNKASSIQSLIPRLSLLMQPCNWSMGNFDQQNLNWSWASILELRQLVYICRCIHTWNGQEQEHVTLLLQRWVKNFVHLHVGMFRKQKVESAFCPTQKDGSRSAGSSFTTWRPIAKVCLSVSNS